LNLEKQTIELLEFLPIREAVASLARSPGGSALVMEQGFDVVEEVLNRKKDIVSDWKKILGSDLKEPEMYFPEISFINRLEKSGMVLEGIELADAAEYILSSLKLKKYGLQQPDNIKLSGALLNEAEIIPELGDYAADIFREINADGTVRDNHPLLRSARAKIANLHGKISKISAGYMNDNREIWQSAVAPQRDGRVVLPLKANFRGRVKGMVHEVSSSGATLFIEPFDLVELNNEMTYEQGMLAQLTYKIYRALTDRLREAAAGLKQLTEQVSYIDSWYARASYSIRNNCIRPEQIENGIIIRSGRHPLLGKKAVPISLSFSDEIKILIITGPNAGGKTVTLKTCGLFVLMNQFALELPAKEGTAVSVFNGIYADIGDDQSIEQSLSTFSGHMKRIGEIISSADKNSLVLLDELGSGTDPTQGSAISMAVLDNLLCNNIPTIITSHHAAVKNFGYTHRGAVNASVSFDSETLKPTYEIIEGVPGESHAVEIAQSMGLPDSIIKKAGEFLENGDATVSEMIKELERRHYGIIERDKKLAVQEKKLLEDRREIDLFKLKLRQKQHEIDQNDYSRLRSFVRDSRRELENLVRELREGEITREKTQNVKNHIAGLDDRLLQEKERIDSDEFLISEAASVNNDLDNISDSDSVLKIGDEVIYIKNKKTGVLLEKRKPGKWLVAFGNIKLTINEHELSVLRKKKESTVFISKGAMGFGGSAVFELDLRGMRANEAENELIKQIDAALMSGLNEFSIIHGLGEGILQKTVHDYLSTCSAVREFSYSHPEHGGFGKTIVRL